MKHFANLNFRSVLLFVFSLLLFQTGFSQANPVTSNLPISFLNQANSTLPTFMAVHRFGTTTASIPTTRTTADGNADLPNTTTNNSGGWIAEGANGISLLASGSNAAGAVVMEFSTLNNSNVQVTYIAWTVLDQASRTNSIALQYRVGESGVWINVDNPTSSVYATGTVGRTNGTTYSQTLPIGANNQPIVQIRWIYWESAGTAGSRDRLGLDEISVTGSPSTPTLTITPSSITNLTYTTNNGGPSQADSVIISGSALTDFPSDITASASPNFEVSKTSKNTGFADNITIPYTTSSLANTKIYVRLKSGLSENIYNNGKITFSGGGLSTTTPPEVSLSGSVTSVPPPVVTTTGTLSRFYTIVGSPSASQSYFVAGNNLVNDITITAPADFEIKTGAGAYANTLTLTPSSGIVPTTTIDVRLKGTTVGNLTGQNITNISTTASSSVVISGTVGTSCGTATDIATVRAVVPPVASNTGGTTNYTITGTITGIFGVSKFYVQDATGGIAVFSTNVVSNNNLAVGDQVTLSGIPVRFNGEAQINGPILTASPLTRGPIPCITKISTGTALTPIVFNANTPPSGVNLPTFLDNNEGKLVKVISVNLSNTGTFVSGTSGTNYPITACNSQGDGEIRIDVSATTIVSQPIPTVSQDITGVVGNYINASGTVNILQVFPRTIADFANSSTPCVTPVPSPSASCGPITFTSVPVDSTLDVTCWNVEWLGNTTTSPSALGPTNDGQQMTNVMSVLKNTKSDIFCIEEVCDYKKFVDSVKTNLPKYKVRCQTKYYSHFFDSPEVSTDAKTFGQKVCFVYDSTVVSMVDTVSLLASQYGYNVTPVATPYPNNWASGRLPFMFIGNVNIGGKTKQVHFVGLHAKSGSDAASYTRRKQDVIDLKAKLDADYPNANIIMLGDYNDDLDSSIYVGNASTYKNFVTDATNYRQITKSLSDCAVSSTAKYSDIIDHIMVSNEIGVIPASGPNPAASASDIYYLEKTVNVSRPINYVTNYTTSTSDHYPVNARFRFGLPPVPPATITSIATGNWSSPSTWDCNCVPTSASDVIVDTAHTVTVDAASQAKTLNLKGTLNWVASFTLSLGM